MKLFSVFKSAPKRAGFIAALAAAIIIPAAAFAWGPDRPTYTTDNPADHVTFNSITNNPVQGDERNFVQVRDASADNSSYADSISLTPGKEYVVFMYFHNDAASNLNASGTGIATGAYAKAQIPAVVPTGGNGTQAVGYIGAVNATPKEVFDDVTFKNTTGANIALQYEAGSATLHSKGKLDGQTMADSIVTTGAPIGFDTWGTVPGCNDYAGYVTFRVKATQPNFTIQKQVRLSGTTTWSENVAAKPGDTVDYQIEYQNTGSTTQNNVVIKDQLPAGETYVKGSTYLKNDANTTPKLVSDDLFGTGINIGSYAPNANAFLKFSAKVNNDNTIACGTTTQTNTATAETDNGSKSDTASVSVTKTCTTPTPPITPVSNVTPTQTPTELPSTGPEMALGGILGSSSLGLGLRYWLSSRRALKDMLLK